MILKNKFRLVISRVLVNKMQSYSSNVNTEVCGVLIGKEIKHNQIVVSNILLDKNSINASRFSVTRNTKALFPYVKEMVDKSTLNDVDFIGDWHSHPYCSSMYSDIDYYSMKAMLNDPDYNFLNSIVLIIACPPNKIKGYLFQRNRKLPKNMTIVMN